jgi:hypothetical protein
MTDPKPTGPELVTSGGEPTTSGGWRSAGPKIKAAARSRSLQIGAGLGVLGLLAAGAQVSGADFNDMVQIGVDAKTGTLDINADGQQGNPTPYLVKMPLEQFKPGDTASKTIEVRNTGTLPAKVSVTVVGQGAGYLGNQLDATVTASPAGGPPFTYTAKANGLSLEPFRVPASGAVPLTLTLTLPADTDNTWQGKTDTLTLTLNAVQE